jgi:predicted RNase H-like nuclease (RuvC/YqgF family)
MSEVQKESYVDDAKRRIAHLSYKLEEAEKKIKTLEYDNAELVRWTNDTCVPRLQELTDELVNRYNQKRYRGKNYNDLRWKEREEQRD